MSSLRWQFFSKVIKNEEFIKQRIQGIALWAEGQAGAEAWK